ncbi:hypothetical protein CL620_04940 [archaeon]|jgi:Holliday junction resolvasome RuvABC endonuclease subunit|nr:hypothetical protein [archaeon]
MKSLGKLNDFKIIAIDPSTKSLAYAIMNTDEDILEVGKIDLSLASDIHDKLFIISQSLPPLLEKYEPKVAVVEEAVFIQNFRTSKVIAYVIGHTIGVLAEYCKFVSEANPLTWKSALGYKRVTKKDVATWERTLGGVEGRKRAAFERKNRIRLILNDEVDIDLSGYDSDEIDALAIGIWYNRSK